MLKYAVVIFTLGVIFASVLFNLIDRKSVGESELALSGYGGPQASLVEANVQRSMSMQSSMCVQVNASRDTGPFGLFDIPGEQIEIPYIEKLKKNNPSWMVFRKSERDGDEAPCKPALYVDISAKSVSFDRRGYDGVNHNTYGVVAGYALYIPSMREHPVTLSAMTGDLSEMVSILAMETKNAIEMAGRVAAIEPLPAPALDEISCISLSSIDQPSWLHVAENMLYSARHRVILGFGDYGNTHKNNCKPDVFVGHSASNIASSTGEVEGDFTIMTLRRAGDVITEVHLGIAVGRQASLVKAINDINHHLKYFEQKQVKRLMVERAWSEADIVALFDQLVSSAAESSKALVTMRELEKQMNNLRMYESNYRQQREVLSHKRDVARAQWQKARESMSNASELLALALISDRDLVHRVSDRYISASIDHDVKEMISEIMTYSEANAPTLQNSQKFNNHVSGVWSVFERPR